MTKILCVVLSFTLISFAPCSGAEDGKRELDEWLKAQTAILSWSADVTQIRKLASIKRTLSAPGKIWFVAPNRFRWQLGQPAKTLAIRNDQQLLILYPRLKRAERYSFSGVDDPAMRQALLLLEVGFPSDSQKFYAQYDFLNAQISDELRRFELQPRDPQARQLINTLRLEVRRSDGRLAATELTFPDGSTMRNEFSAHQINIDIPASQLETSLEGYEVVEPLGGP